MRLCGVVLEGRAQCIGSSLAFIGWHVSERGNDAFCDRELCTRSMVLHSKLAHGAAYPHSFICLPPSSPSPTTLQVIRLSGATQELPRSHICNVHGVGERFLAIGEKMAAAAAAIAEGKVVPGKQRKAKGHGKKQLQQQQLAEQAPAAVRVEAPEVAATSSSSSSSSKSSSRVKASAFSKGAYYLGKMVWGKGYRELLDLLEENRESLGDIDVDVFGSGADSGEVRAEAHAKKLRVKFHPGRDHADTSLHG